MDNNNIQDSITNAYNYLKNQEHQLAIKIFLSIENFTNNIDVVKGLALCYYYTNQHDNAIRYLSTYLLNYPNDYKYRKMLCESLINFKNYEEALEHFILLLPHDSSNSLIKKILVCFKNANFNKENKIIKLNSLIKANDLITEFYCILSELINTEEAISLLNNAKFKIVDNSIILAKLFKLYQSSGNSIESHKICVELLSRKPNNQIYKYYLYRSTFELGNFVEALRLVTQLYNSNPNNFHYSYSQGLCYYELFDLPEAINKLTESKLKANNNSWIFSYNIGLCYMSMGQLETAKSFFIEALSMKPNKPDVIYNLGNIYYSQGNFQKAKEVFSKIMDYSAPTINDSVNELTILNLQNKSIQVTHERVIRDLIIVKKLKKMYNNKCQICATKIPIGKDYYYSEAHHIRPLGKKHSGPDEINNLIILCPNHHTAFDNGCIGVSPLTKEVFQFNGTAIEKIGILHLHPEHKISEECIKYYQTNIFLGRL